MPVDLTNRRLYIDRVNKLGITPQEVSLCLQDYRVDTNGNVDVGMMCSSPKVNKWSLNKPFKWAKWGYSIDAAGDAEKAAARKAVRQGLTAVEVSKILKSSVGYSEFESSTKDDGLAEVSEWAYDRPTGGASSPFRLPDFDGYEHDAVAPDGQWRTITFKDDTIDELINATITVEGSGYDFEMIPSTNSGLYSTFAMMFNQASGVEIGTTDKMEISISDIASFDGNYRLAMAVWIPNFGTNGGWGFFASRKVIGQYTGGAGDNLRDLFPDFATNPFAMYYIKKHYTDTNTKSFLAVPLLVKDLGYIYQTNPAGGSNLLFNLRAVSGVTGVTEAYCMPSGQKDVSVYFDIVSAADVKDAEVVKFLSPSGWYVAYKYDGNKVDAPGTTVDLNRHTLFVGSVRPIENDVKVTLTGTIRYRTPNDPATELADSLSFVNQTINAGATTIINGVAYHGVTVVTRPELTMKETDVTTFTVTEA